ncbi:MAG: FG-GAP-like repeat-containing protein [Bacteroidia bacterium]
MKKAKLLALFLLQGIYYSAYSQTYTGKEFILNSDQSGTTKTYVARDQIKLQPGFKYTPQSGKSFRAYIDKNIIVDADYIPVSNDYYNRNINTSLLVGTTNGNASVTPLGSASYNIGFTIPKGSGNLEPSVGIAYNSMQGSGLLGIGWNIVGLSAITRTGQTIFDDNNYQGVTYSYSDRFSLDGERLFVANYSTDKDASAINLYGKHGTEYFNQGANSKIISYETEGDGPKWFKVFTANGLTIEYGNTADSRFKPIGKNTVLIWGINKITDQNGNYITFSYRHLDGEMLIDEIKYTGNQNTGLEPYNSIKFYYEFRQDKNIFFNSGGEIRQTVLLREVDIRVEGSLYRKYDFEYAYDKTSKLISVQETTHTGESLNPTIFKYHENTAYLTKQSITLPEGDVDYYPGDFNNDGLMDMACLFYSVSSDSKSYTSLDVYINSGNGFNKQSSFGEVFSTPYYYDFYFPSGRSPVSFSDFNGDGLDDIALTRSFSTYGSLNLNVSNRSTSVKSSYTYVYTKFSNGGDFTNEKSSDRTDLALGGKNMFAQLKGDFSTQIVSTNRIHNNILYPFSIYDPDKNKDYIITNLPYSYGEEYEMGNKFFIIDYDGDGTSEVLIQLTNKFQVYDISYNRSQDTYSANKIHEGTTFKAKDIGDFNGDRITDYLWYDYHNDKWWIYYGKGNGTFLGHEVNFIDKVSPEDVNFVIVGDINGDGKSDIFNNHIVMKEQILSFSNHYVPDYSRLETYEFFGLSASGHVYEANSIDESSWTLFRDYALDLTGDGKADVWNNKIYSFYKNSKSSLLNKAYDGFNNDVVFNYISLSQDKSIYSGGNNSNDQFITFNKPLYIVSSTHTKNKGLSYDIKEFNYGGLKLNREGRGLLGFSPITVKDYSSNIITTMYSWFFENDSKQLPRHIISKRIDNNEILSETTNTYIFKSSSIFKHGQTVLQSQFVDDKSTNSSYNVTYEYDDFFNNTKSTKVYSSQNDTEVIERNYVNFASWWYSGLVENSQVSLSNQSGPSKTDKASFLYDSKGRIIKKTDFELNADQLFTELEYDMFGNIVSKEVSSTATNVIPTKQSSVYDDKGRYLTRSIDPLNEVTSYVVDKLTGSVVEKSIDNGKYKFTYKLDPIGRTIEATDPFGNSNIEYAWDNPNGGNYAYYILTSGDNMPSQKKFFGSLGQELKTETSTYSGVAITTTSYNQKGLVANTTSPHYDGQEHVSNTFTYDPLNRILSTNVDGLGSQTYSYTKLSGGGFEVTMVGLDGKTTKKRTDYRGRDFESEDDGGIIRYHHTVDGLVEKITLNGNEVNRMEYNPYGHQTKLIDVNSGTSFYEYNIVGQLMSQTDANGNEYNFEYDVLGNMLQRQAPDGVTLYEYYYGGAKHGLLKQVTGHNNISESFVYNDLGLLTSVEEHIENKTYTSSYEYDQFGNNTKVIYPSGLQIKKQYDAEGNMTQVSNAQNNQRIWEIGSINANGQYTAYTTGNKSSTRKYNKYGIAQQFTTQGIQDLKFTFDDKTANLLEREDVLKGLKETFEYDNLDRLTKFEVPGLIAIQMQYANSGNIDFKTDAGAYLYNDVKKNAVEHVVPPTGVSTISENEQNISYTSFNKVSEIEEGDFRLEFTYGPDQQRSKTVLYEQGQIKYTKYFSHLSEEIEVFGQNATSPMTIEYISGGHGLAAINVVQNNTSTIYFAYTDHLGTIVALTDASGNVVHEQNFDAWGRRRDVNTWEYITTPIATGEDFWWLRGYTGHEHLEEFVLINMNGRLYDPILGRMLSPDNYVQSELFSQSYNRYTYAFNNPLKYTDPDGDNPLLIAAAVYFVFFTETGYDAQKYFSPVAVKVDISLGTHQRGLGIRASVGMPQIAAVSVRGHAGIGYYWKNYDVTPGWEKTYGYEIGITPFLVTGTTYYDSPGEKFDQQLWNQRIGIPGLNIKYENDYSFGSPFSDGGDGHRTAALKVQIGPVHIGFNLFTGDPGLNDRETERRSDGFDYYVKNPRTGNDPDEFRAGVGYVGIGPFRFGTDTEDRRHKIQNVLIHDRIGSPRFTILNRRNKFYFQFGSGGGYLW